MGAWSLSRGTRGTRWRTPWTGCRLMSGHNRTHIHTNYRTFGNQIRTYVFGMREEISEARGEHANSVNTGRRRDPNPRPKVRGSAFQSNAWNVLFHKSSIIGYEKCRFSCIRSTVTPSPHDTTPQQEVASSKILVDHLKKKSMFSRCLFLFFYFFQLFLLWST